MTASPSTPPGPNTPQSGGGDPSMEDILASIRRILSEEDANEPPPPTHDVVPLDASMLVEEPEGHAAPPPAPQPAPAPAPEVPPVTIAAPAPPAPPPPNPTPSNPTPAQADAGLLAPEVVAKASSSVGSLLRTLVSERQQVSVRAGGPTIEDLMREEIRPLLKAWLDANLPQLVERLVRAEIERLVGRALS